MALNVRERMVARLRREICPNISTSGRVLLLFSPGSAFSTRSLKVPPGTGERQTVKRASFVSALCVILVLTLTSAYAQDNWNGGGGNWSDAGRWSAGLPGPGSDVVIHNPGSFGDFVTLDTSPTINSLTLGGVYAYCCCFQNFCSQLRDGGVAQTLSITNGLTIGQDGLLSLTGASTVSAGTVNNSGALGSGAGATLNLTNQPGGITDVVAGSGYG